MSLGGSGSFTIKTTALDIIWGSNKLVERPLLCHMSVRCLFRNAEFTEEAFHILLLLPNVLCPN